MPELSVIGTVEGCLTNEFDKDLFVRWTVDFDRTNWVLEHGAKAGISQSAKPGESGLAVLSHPLELHFSTSAVEGWPKLLIEVWSRDEFNRQVLEGYGLIAIPTRPGIHCLECQTWRPKIKGTFGGITAQVKDTSGILEAASRKHLETVAGPVALVELHVLARGWEEHHVSLA